MAWADILSRLGRAEGAIAMYEGFDDSNERLLHPGPHTQSFAERGALWQQLGPTDHAIEMYRRFLEAWEHADPELQPLVDRAQRAIAALEGTVEPVRQ